MRQRTLVSLWVVVALLFPTVCVNADDLNTSSKATAQEHASEKSLGLTLLGIGAAVFAVGIVRQATTGCRYPPCGHWTRAGVAMTGVGIGSVGAWMVWWKDKGGRNPSLTEPMGRGGRLFDNRWTHYTLRMPTNPSPSEIGIPEPGDSRHPAEHFTEGERKAMEK
jgi:hypothetical protein